MREFLRIEKIAPTPPGLTLPRVLNSLLQRKEKKKTKEEKVIAPFSLDFPIPDQLYI